METIELIGLSPAELERIGGEFRKLRHRLIAHLNALNVEVPAMARLRNRDIEHIADDSVRAARRVVYRRNGPFLVWLAGQMASRIALLNKRPDKKKPVNDGVALATAVNCSEQEPIVGDFAQLPRELVQLVTTWPKYVKVANSNRRRWRE